MFVIQKVLKEKISATKVKNVCFWLLYFIFNENILIKSNYSCTFAHLNAMKNIKVLKKI